MPGILYLCCKNTDIFYAHFATYTGEVNVLHSMSIARVFVTEVVGFGYMEETGVLNKIRPSSIIIILWCY